MILKDVLVIGAGPAGLSAAIEAGSAGADVLLVDLNIFPGGQLFKQIHKFFGSSAHHAGIRGYDIAKSLLKEAQEAHVEIWLQSNVIGVFPNHIVGIERVIKQTESEIVNICAKKIIFATGASENVIRFKGWTTPGVMGAGAAQTMINVNHVKPGKKIVMLGSGNVGLIVSYQLMQAGCDVVALIEAAPKIGGYAVHAAKIKRAGVPIYTSHTIIEAKSDVHGCVNACVIAKVDENFNPIEGTEETISCDTITLAAGLKPTIDLMKLSACKLTYSSTFGGYIPLHDSNMETSCPGIFVAGDATGVEEASTALEEGKIAGICAVEELELLSKEEATQKKENVWKRLSSLRQGPFGDRRMQEKLSILQEYENTIANTIPVEDSDKEVVLCR